MTTPDIHLQLEVFKEYLRQSSFPAGSPLYRQALDFIERLPRKLSDEERTDINALLTKAFNLDKLDVALIENRFEKILPPEGWFARYLDYTAKSEPPAVFHFACAYATVGAALERFIYFDKGLYKVYPNVAVCLIAPTGRCRKTSAMLPALSIARAIGVNVISEKITPEALIDGLKGREGACGYLAAPELADFMGRQKYLEGLVPLLTALFDAPDHYASTTIVRGSANLSGVALSFLGASTVEWFLEALPREAFSGGFMARILFVVQESTDRRWALPPKLPPEKEASLKEELAQIRLVRGEVTLTPEAREWYETWYRRHHETYLTDDKFAGYHERKPDHVLRMAMILHVASTSSLDINVKDLETALRILDWIESTLPRVFTAISSSPSGQLQQRVMTLLEKSGGQLSHSSLLRQLQHLLNAKTLHEVIGTLKESETIMETKTNLGKVYTLLRRQK